MKIPSFLFVTRKELISLWSVIFIIFVSLFYILLTLFLLNYRLVGITILSSEILNEKIATLFSLVGGLFTAFSPADTIILFLNAILVGINILLMIRTLSRLKDQGKIRLAIGGTTLVGFISAGCSSCGFSVLSIIGLSTSLSFLPFHGMELHLLALIVLLFSSWYMLKRLRESVYCKR